MKKIITLLTLGCVSGFMWAQQSSFADLSTNQLVAGKSVVMTNSLVQANAGSSFSEKIENLQTGLNLPAADDYVVSDKDNVASLLHKIGKADIREITRKLTNNYKEKLDSFVTYDDLGNKLAGDFMTYDSENLFILKHVHSKWNNETQTWDDTEIKQYEWDDNGNLLKSDVFSIEFGFGSSNEYTYDANNNVLSEILSQTDAEGKVTPSQKTVFGYDEYNNLTDQVIYMYDGNVKDWANYLKFHAEYNEKKEMVLKEDYMWNGSGWMGSGKTLWAYNDKGLLIMSDMKAWDAGINDWVNFKLDKQAFNENGLLTEQEFLFWNEEKGDYSGNYEATGQRNTKAIVTYDDNNHEVADRAYYDFEDGKGWILTTEILTDWTPGEDGGWNTEANCYMSWNGQSLEEKALRSRTLKSINRKNLLTHELSQITNDNGETWSDYSELTFKYWKDSVMIYDETIEQGLNKAKGEYEINERGEVINSTHYWGTSDGKDWTLYSYFEYEYEPDVTPLTRIRKMGYLWDGSKFVKNFGEAYEYDFDIDFEKVNMGMVEVDWDFKMVKHYAYTADVATDEWKYQVGNYYYSDIAGSGAVDKIGATDVRIYPNPVVDTLIIESEQGVTARIYDVNGRCLLETAEKNIDMDGFLPGIYLVNVNGNVYKVVKK